jgi:hypothetical protein
LNDDIKSAALQLLDILCKFPLELWSSGAPSYSTAGI